MQLFVWHFYNRIFTRIKGKNKYDMPQIGCGKDDNWKNVADMTTKEGGE